MHTFLLFWHLTLDLLSCLTILLLNSQAWSLVAWKEFLDAADSPTLLFWIYFQMLERKSLGNQIEIPEQQCSCLFRLLECDSYIVGIWVVLQLASSLYFLSSPQVVSWALAGLYRTHTFPDPESFPEEAMSRHLALGRSAANTRLKISESFRLTVYPGFIPL